MIAVKKSNLQGKVADKHSGNTSIPQEPIIEFLSEQGTNKSTFSEETNDLLKRNH